MFVSATVGYLISRIQIKIKDFNVMWVVGLALYTILMCLATTFNVSAISHIPFLVLLPGKLLINVVESSIGFVVIYAAAKRLGWLN